jgi:hypothetical protein
VAGAGLSLLTLILTMFLDLQPTDCHQPADTHRQKVGLSLNTCCLEPRRLPLHRMTGLITYDASSMMLSLPPSHPSLPHLLTTLLASKSDSSQSIRQAASSKVVSSNLQALH